MLTNFYIDGFNLYNGSLKGTSYKWLDFSVLFRNLFPNAQIRRIRYFTALVKATPNDPQKRQRQQIYIRAIKTIPSLSVHLGRFQTNIKRLPLAHPPTSGSRMVDVMRTEEKGSDVNLASYLLLDGFRKEYEQAVIVSNDADLVTPIKIARDEFGLKVGLLNPQEKPSLVLKEAVDFYRKLRQGPLSVSQFSNSLEDADGVFRKPARWQ